MRVVRWTHLHLKGAVAVLSIDGASRLDGGSCVLNDDDGRGNEETCHLRLTIAEQGEVLIATMEECKCRLMGAGVEVEVLR